MKSLLLRLVYRLLRARRPRRVGAVSTVLVLQYQMPLGCCVHFTPLLAAIKSALPNGQLVVATRGMGAALLRNDPHIDHLIETDDPMASLTALLRTVRDVRQRLRHLQLSPDLILQDAANRRGRFALFALLLRLAPTAGFADAPALYDIPLTYDPALSLIDNNLRLASLVGAAPEHSEPAVFFAAADLEAARTLLPNASDALQPVAAFAMQGSGGQQTHWHDDRFADLIRCVEELGCNSVFLGTAADAAAIERILILAGSEGQSLAGRTTVPQLAALLCLADLLITVDTGTMHVGRAAQVPMVVLGPSWQPPLEWLPLGLPQVRVLRGRDRGDVPPGYRLDEISVAAAAAAVDDLRQHYPASTEQRQRRVDRLLSTRRM